MKKKIVLTVDIPQYVVFTSPPSILPLFLFYVLVTTDHYANILVIQKTSELK